MRVPRQLGKKCWSHARKRHRKTTWRYITELSGIVYSPLLMKNELWLLLLWPVFCEFFFFFFCRPLNLCDVAPHGFSVSPCSSVRVKQADLRISLCCGPSQIALLHQAVDLWLVDSVNSATTTQSHLYLAVATFKPWQPVIIRRRMLMEANILLYDLCYVCRAFWNLLCTLY